MTKCIAPGCTKDSNIAGLCTFHAAVHHRGFTRAKLAKEAAVRDWAKRHAQDHLPYAQQVELYDRRNEKE